MDDDPAIVRLRDAVGALRALYAAARPRDTAERRGGGLVEGSARVLALLRPLGGGDGVRVDDPQRPPPMPPWHERDDVGSNSGPASDDEGA